MQSTQTWLIARDDTFLGVCQGLGEDLGINPLWLRLAFSVSLLWNPTAVIAAYLGAGVLVLATRLIAPNPRRAATAEPAPAAGKPQGELPLELEMDNDNAEDLAAAA
jgi:phage shock protein PspC (stress-responsive transcriptional regulator)